MGLFDLFKSADDYWQMADNYMFGKNGCAKNHTKALEYFEKAYAKNTSKPLVNMVYLYSLTPELMKANRDKIFALSKRDAANNNLSQRDKMAAINNLATCYCRGYGVEKNLQEGLKWYRKAAELGSAEASYNYAVLGYKSVEEDIDVYFAARKYIEYALDNRKLLSKGASAKIDEEYKRLFETLSEKELKGKTGHILHNKGLDFEFGRNGLPKNPKEAQRWYRAAFAIFQKESQGNSGIAFNNLAICYYNGNGCEKDREKARACFIKSRELGFSGAETLLYKWFPDQKELDSISKVKADADSDSPSEDALIEMALYYLDREDAEKAVAYAKKAINLHNSADGRVIYGIVSEFGLKPYKQNIQYVDSTYYNAVNAKNGPTRPRLQYVVAEFCLKILLSWNGSESEYGSQYILKEHAFPSKNSYVETMGKYVQAAISQNYYKAYELDGYINFKFGDNKDAIKYLKIALDNGVTSAAAYLGLIYYDDDIEKGIFYFEHFIDNPHDKLTYKLEEMCYLLTAGYYQNRGNDSKYRKYLEGCCELGNSASKYNLIRHLALGERGYEIDYPRAKKMCLEMMDDPTYGSMVRELMKLL